MRRDFGRTRGRADFGRGYSVEPPRSNVIRFEDFSGGYDSSAVDGSAGNASPLAVDVYVDDRGRIRRVAGVKEIESYVGRSLQQLALHASLDKISELVLFDPPFLGVKSSGETRWIDVGLSQSKQFFAWTNFGTELIFSNGVGGVWSRESQGEVKKLKEAPPARAYASFGGRLLAGNAIIEGTMEPLGVRWSAASAMSDDWNGLGGGFELLLDDLSYGDEILSFVPMGLDHLAIVMRRSVWVASLTRLLDRPFDFRPVVRGQGFVNRRVAVATPAGVIGLSDNGVFVFTGSGMQHISKPIDSDLLPLDHERLREYAAAYHPRRAEYWLFTPTETWVFDVQRGRWSRRTLIARDAAWWAPMIEGERWSELVGTWAEQNNTWLDYKSEHLEELDFAILGNEVLGQEDELEACNFSGAMKPFWRFPRQLGEELDQQITVQSLDLQYQGGGIVGLRFPNLDGALLGHSAYELGERNRPSVAVLHPLVTGEGLGLQLDFGLGNVAVSKVAVRAMARSRDMAEVPPVRVEAPDYNA